MKRFLLKAAFELVVCQSYRWETQTTNLGYIQEEPRPTNEIFIADYEKAECHFK